MGSEAYGPITPSGGRSLSRRQYLRIAALVVLAMGGALFARTAMKPPGPGRTGSLRILAAFLSSNGIPILLTLKLPSRAVLVRVTAALGVLTDGLVIVVMSLYALIFIQGGWNRVSFIAVAASIGAALVCGAALLFRAEPLEKISEMKNDRQDG